MKVSKRELIAMVRDAYVEGYMTGGELNVSDFAQAGEEEARDDFRSAEIYWALRNRLGLDNG